MSVHVDMVAMTSAAGQLVQTPNNQDDVRPHRTTLIPPADTPSIIFINHMTIEAPSNMAQNRESYHKPEHRPAASVAQDRSQAKGSKSSGNSGAKRMTRRAEQHSPEHNRAYQLSRFPPKPAETHSSRLNPSLQHSKPRTRTGVHFAPSTKAAAPSPGKNTNMHHKQRIERAKDNDPKAAAQPIPGSTRKPSSEKRKHELDQPHQHQKNGRRSRTAQTDIHNPRNPQQQPSRPRAHQRMKSYERKRPDSDASGAKAQKIPRQQQSLTQRAPAASPLQSDHTSRNQQPSRSPSAQRYINWPMPHDQQSFRPRHPLGKGRALRTERECFVLAPTALEQSQRLSLPHPSPRPGDGVARHGSRP